METSEKDFLEEIEALIKEELTLTIINVFNEVYSKIQKDKLIYFNQQNISVLNSLLYWTINVNTLQINHGDITTNSIIKFFQLIFADSKTMSNDKEYLQYKKDFMVQFEALFLNKLNNQHNKERIALYEIRNGYINVYLTPKQKEVLISCIEKKKETNANKYTVCIYLFIYLFLV